MFQPDTTEVFTLRGALTLVNAHAAAHGYTEFFLNDAMGGSLLGSRLSTSGSLAFKDEIVLQAGAKYELGLNAFVVDMQGQAVFDRGPLEVTDSASWTFSLTPLPEPPSAVGATIAGLLGIALGRLSLMRKRTGTAGHPTCSIASTAFSSAVSA
jgi:hypothetical protein